MASAFRARQRQQAPATTPQGKLRVFAVSGTPGDWRSAENTRRDVRRGSLREDGMLEVPEPQTPPPRQPN
jgi:hypothetical protein